MAMTVDYPAVDHVVHVIRDFSDARDGLPDLQRRWRDGTLVAPGTPETD